MPRDPATYLQDMVDRAAFVLSLRPELSRRRLDDDRVMRSAIERELMVLGEAMYQLRRLSPDLAAQIPSSDEIVGFRHILVHGYDILNLDVIWAVIEDDLTPLQDQAKKLLEQITR